MPVVGYLLALCSAVCNGSFAAAQKLPSVVRANPHPIVFNSFVCFGVVVSSIVTMPFLPLVGAELKFNYLACFSGALFVGAILCSFLAIPRLGLAVAQGIWGGCALLVSFVWGVAGPVPVGKAPSSWAGSLCGIALLLVGILGLVFHEMIALRACGKEDDDTMVDAAQAPLVVGDSESSSVDYLRKESLTEDVENDMDSTTTTTTSDTTTTTTNSDKLLGIFFALLTGIFGGSVNVPSTLTQAIGEPLKGIETLPSFGLGAMIVGLLVPIVYFNLVDTRALRETGGLHVRTLVLPGLVSGTIWNVGNIASVYANGAISFAVAQPLMQCALLVSGILGIFVFKEITGWQRIVTFFVFALVVLGGAGLLAVFGPS